MVLPQSFHSLPVSQQLFVLANLERVDRGLSAIDGLSAALNSSALQGAVTDSDPAPEVFYGNAYSANWAAGFPSSLEADFVWMYDDGLNSGNLDCKPSVQTGCSGHRHDILWPFDQPIAMGAASATDTQQRSSMTELFVGGDAQDALVPPLWSSITELLPVGLFPSAVTLMSGTTSASVTVAASGEAMTVSASITAGGGSWSVSPASCDLAAGETCVLTATLISPDSPSSGTLTVHGPNGFQTVALTVQIPTKLTIRVASPTVRRGRHTGITGQLRGIGLADVSRQIVSLERRLLGSATVKRLKSGRTDALGRIRFDIAPSMSATYWLRFSGSPWLQSSVSPRGKVTVRKRPRP